MRFSWQTIAAALLFSTWFAGMVAVQIGVLAPMVTGRTWPWLVAWKKWDVLELCPRFSFFSWLPSAHYALFVRDFYSGPAAHGQPEPTPWRAVELPPRRWYRFLWNPVRRVRFSLEDAAKALVHHLGRVLARSATEREREDDLDCFAYAFLRHYTAQLPAFPAATQRQFLLAQRRTAADPLQWEPLFVSPPFAMGAATGNPRALPSIREEQDAA